MSIQDNIVAGIYPHSRGVGYAVMRDAGSILHYGHPRIQTASNQKTLELVRKIIRDWSPSLLIIRDENAKELRQSQRLQKLMPDIRRVAQDADTYTICYSRKEIKGAFSTFGITDRYGAAMKIADWFPKIAEALPPRRKLWQCDHHRMALFDAIALIVTHYHTLTMDDHVVS